MYGAKRWSVVTALVIAIAIWSTHNWFSRASSDPSVSVRMPSSPVPESPDFATLIFRDPWDMSEFSDISQYLNESGQKELVQNIQVQNGIFSAQSTSSRDPYFFPLFPGYETTMLIGKVGVQYPIPSAAYHCLYVAMKVNSGPADSWGPDQFQIFWFADERLNTGGAPWGFSAGIPLYPEAGAGTPEHSGRLYSVNLATVTSGGTPWTAQTYWRGLRIDPTIQANIEFEVDWVRLTNCESSIQTITWTPDASVDTIWVRPVGTTRDIRVVTSIDGSAGTYNLDIQGLAPGSYLVGLGTPTTCCTGWSSNPLIINQTPIATFARPSFTSGTDYATSAGNPWDFSDGSDVTQILNAATAMYQDGVLDLVTLPGSPPGGMDVQIHLNTPQPANGSDYRYLTFRLYTEGLWQNVPEGMIARWIWTIPSMTGQPGYECHLVSQDIPYDVGWQTYTIDLTDTFNGSVEETSPPQGSPHCPSLPFSWSSSSAIIKMRFDPNENITDSPFHQQLDWIRLIQVDRIAQGTPFLVQISLNKPLESQLLSFYYTTDPQGNPTQHIALPCPSSPPVITGPFRIYLPLMTHDHRPVLNETTFCWDTTSVPSGEYYLCVTANDGYNQATYCSEAPVRVHTP